MLRIRIGLIFFILLSLFSFTSRGYFNLALLAVDCPASDYDCQIKDIQREIDALSPAHEKNKAELGSLNSQLRSLNEKIKSLQTALKNTQIDIEKREESLAYAREIFDTKANMHYRYLRLYDPVSPFLAGENASSVFRDINIRQRVIDDDRKTMEKYGEDLIKLKEDKEKLEKNKVSLSQVQAKVDERAKFLSKEVEKVESYISTLSAKQQELAALKAGGFSTSIGETPETLEPCSGAPGTSNFCDPGFKPAFAAFSFGAPHRTGMSQYGAFGRAKAGQNAETILAAYYQGSSLNKSFDTNGTIGVTGIGRVSIEDNYLLGIYEIPEKWGNEGGFEALKAQAVAARSYAMAVTNNGAGNICTTESCQVYKPQLKSGKWKEAVQATRGWVLMKDGQPAKTYFASTSGGYTISQWGWSGIKDTAGDWPGSAYEKMGGSPWFYKGWYKSRGGKTCSRSNPWLTSEEMADILNAWKVLTGGGGDVSRVTPIDTSCWSGNPYSKEDLRNIGGFTSVSSSGSVVYNNNGTTQSVSFSTNKGSITISGEELKKAFNLRAPGYVGIKSSLFNIEKL